MNLTKKYQVRDLGEVTVQTNVVDAKAGKIVEGVAIKRHCYEIMSSNGTCIVDASDLPRLGISLSSVPLIDEEGEAQQMAPNEILKPTKRKYVRRKLNG